MPAGRAGEPRDALGEQLGRARSPGEEVVVGALMAPQQQRAPHHRTKVYARLSQGQVAACRHLNLLFCGHRARNRVALSWNSPPAPRYETALPGTVSSHSSFTAEACWKLTNDCLDVGFCCFFFSQPWPKAESFLK